MTLPELPKPFSTEYDDIDNVEVPCYSPAQMRSYAEEAVKQEREACAQECDALRAQFNNDGSLHAAYSWAARNIRHRSQEAALRRMNEIDRELGLEP